MLKELVITTIKTCGWILEWFDVLNWFVSIKLRTIWIYWGLSVRLNDLMREKSYNFAIIKMNEWKLSNAKRIQNAGDFFNKKSAFFNLYAINGSKSVYQLKIDDNYIVWKKITKRKIECVCVDGFRLSAKNAIWLWSLNIQHWVDVTVRIKIKTNEERVQDKKKVSATGKEINLQ